MKFMQLEDKMDNQYLSIWNSKQGFSANINSKGNSGKLIRRVTAASAKRFQNLLIRPPDKTHLVISVIAPDTLIVGIWRND
jgi:hypothetical protein